MLVLQNSPINPANQPLPLLVGFRNGMRGCGCGCGGRCAKARRGIGDYWTDLATGQQTVVAGGQQPIPSDTFLPITPSANNSTPLMTANSPQAVAACTAKVGAGICSALVAMNAPDSLLYQVASGATDPMTALNQVNGSRTAGLPNVQSSLSDQLLAPLGAAAGAASDAASAAAPTVSSALAWLEKYGPWIGIGAGALLLYGVMRDFL
jgi:hypothetical protein